MTEKVESILIVRLGAMGDILHALPAAASLKQSFPDKKLVWVTRRKWMPILAGNPFIDSVIPFERNGAAALWSCWKRLRTIRPSLAFDFQGLIQSALVGRASRPDSFWGFDRSIAREPLASLFYNRRAAPPGPHRIQRNLQLAQMAGATVLGDATWIPSGHPEGNLPSEPFVLASPFAGWTGKQWPIASYIEVGKRLAREGIPLVMNVAPQAAETLTRYPELRLHVSSLEGLIDATRRATAIIGVDSGPLHLAAALRKPGVAIFGPTDPATNGPYGGSIAVLRSPKAGTTYRKNATTDWSMTDIGVEEVWSALLASMASRNAGTVRQP